MNRFPSAPKHHLLRLLDQRAETRRNFPLVVIPTAVRGSVWISQYIQGISIYIEIKSLFFLSPANHRRCFSCRFSLSESGRY